MTCFSPSREGGPEGICTLRLANHLGLSTGWDRLADSDNSVKVIEINLILLTICGSCKEILYS